MTVIPVLIRHGIAIILMCIIIIGVYGPLIAVFYILFDENRKKWVFLCGVIVCSVITLLRATL